MHNSTPPTPPSGEQSDPTDMGNTEESQLRAPDCFEQWLHEGCLSGETGRTSGLAPRVLRENRAGRWTPKDCPTVLSLLPFL